MKRLFSSFCLYIYNLWCVFWLITVFLVLFPFIWVFIQRKEWHTLAHKLVHLWSVIFFFITGKGVQLESRFLPSKGQAYVFVANHFSYLDVAVGMNVVKNYFAYMGKSSVKKIPLLGYVFAKLHIQVDRSDKGSRTKSLVRAMKSLKSGRSIFIMPEGGILSKNIPQMLQPFKDGAFILAIENQVPIVPISFLNLYRIMPESKLFWGKPRVVMHEPVETAGKTKADIEDLKMQVYKIIQGEIDSNVL